MQFNHAKMSHNQSSACIPPPSDYTPRPPQQSSSTSKSRERDRGGRGGGGAGGSHRGNYRKDRRQIGSHQQTGNYTFQRNQTSENVSDEDKTKSQPRDRFHRNEDDDYFAHIQEEEEDEEVGGCSENNDNNSDNDEDDPLDAYMKSLESEAGSGQEDKVDCDGQVAFQSDNSINLNIITKESTVEVSASTSTQAEFDKRGVRLDIDETDDIEESYYQYVEKQNKGKKAEQLQESEDSQDRNNLVDYDKDGNIIGVRKVKREIEPLPAIDHTKITYETFERNFYQEHDEIKKLTQEQGDELRSKLEIKVSGEGAPKPVCSFAHFKFDEQLMKVIRRSEYTHPTPIQAQAIPAALLGRNIIGIAMTGSGKTAAYLWPMIVHIMEQPDLKRGDGPIALVLVPTRELALQVYGEAKKFSSSYKIAVVCAYGGGSKYEQSKDLEAGAEIVVATPGRIIDMIKLGATNLRRVTYLVLDEADRFFEMGFESQVRSICDQVRPDRQTLLFSATFKKKIEQLARTITDNPVKIIQKSLGEANEDVTQHVIVLPEGPKKWEWLTSKLVEFTSVGSVLIFVTRIVNCEELHKNLNDFGKDTLLLHGDMEQSERNRVITLFKRKEKEIMIATDVAARGLDIAHIRTVINYDVARDIDTHIHRVGRTGRAGSKGDAYTLVTDKDKDFAGHLVKNLESSNQIVSDELMKLAMQSHNFRKSRAPKHHHKGGHYHQSSQNNDLRGYSQKRSSEHQNYAHRHHQSHSDRSKYHSSGNSSNHRGDRDHDRSDSGRYSSSSSSSSYHDHRKRSRWY